jgi:hypothetical protein
MDEEKMSVDIAEALGKSNAVICLQSALIAMLVNKRVMTMADAAELTGVANEILKQMEDISDDARVIAEASLRGLSRSYVRRIKTN